MARWNPNANKRSARLLLLKASACSEPKTKIKTEPNLLAIINLLLAFKEPNNVFEWLGSKDGNSTKLIKFIATVHDDYNELIADYNNLQALKNQNNIQKNGVIQYAQD